MNKPRLVLIPVPEEEESTFEMEGERAFFCPDRMSFSSNGNADELKRCIGQLNPKPLPYGKTIFFREYSPTPTRMDLCGNPIQYVRSEDFTDFEFPASFNQWDRALVEFVKNMPETLILLFWC